MKPGIIQEKWLKSLEEHPERQMQNKLGQGTPENYKACCLGELGLIAGLCYFNNGDVQENNEGSLLSLHEGFGEVGLRSSYGMLSNYNPFISLSNMNDSGKTWPEIAKHVRENFEEFFNKSI